MATPLPRRLYEFLWILAEQEEDLLCFKTDHDTNVLTIWMEGWRESET